MKKPLIACACPPNFPRGVMTFAGLCCLYDHGLTPVMTTGASAGALAALSANEWSDDAFRKGKSTWLNLAPSSISKYRFGDKLLVASAIAGALIHFAPDKKNSFWTHATRALLTLGLPFSALRLVVSQSSFCSSDPLGELLEKNLNFPAIFDSPVKLALVCAEHRTGKRIVHTNFLPEDKDPELLLNTALGSAAIPVIFEPRMVGGVSVTDGARAQQDPLAIDLIEKHANPDRILVFLFYWLPEEPETLTVLSNLDHDNELVVRDKLEDTLAKLPEATREKIVLVMAERPPRKIALSSFTKADLRYLFEMGYAATEATLKTHGLI